MNTTNDASVQVLGRQSTNTWHQIANYCKHQCQLSMESGGDKGWITVNFVSSIKANPTITTHPDWIQINSSLQTACL